MIFTHESYRTYLKSTYTERVLKNPSYSLRGFAKQIGINHTTLVQVLKGDRNLSLERAHVVAEKLGLATDETEYFTLLVQYESAKRPEIKYSLQERLNRFANRAKSYDLTLEHFKMISDWYHLAILQLVKLDGFITTPKSVAEKLSITPIEAESALERLVRLELLEKTEDTYVRTTEALLISSSIKNSALRKFHTQMMGKAIESLESQTPKERLTDSTTVAISKNHLDEAFRIIDECHEKISALGDKTETKTDVYHLCTNFFNLTKTKESK